MRALGDLKRLDVAWLVAGVAASVLVWVAVSPDTTRDQVLAVLLLLIVWALAYLVRADMVVRRRFRRLENLVGDQQTMSERGIASVQSRIDALGEHLDAGSSRLDGHIDSVREATAGVAPDVARRVQRKVAHELRRAGRREFAELEALLELRMLFEPTAMIPPSRGWAASPDVLRMLAELVLNRRPGLVVECGSGASSIWIGYALRRVGGGRLISLEHDAGYVARSTEYVKANGLTDYVEVRQTSLEPWTNDTGTWPWYSLDVVKDLHGIDIVFVDGPPGTTGSHARYPAIPVLLPRCATDAMFVVDDTDRDEEREIVERWLTENPHLEHEHLKYEKGCSLIFTR